MLRISTQNPRPDSGHCSSIFQIPWKARIVITLISLLPASAHAQFYTDTGSPSNPAWSTIFPTLNNNSPDPGPVQGSVINVNNAATEVGLYGNRPISVGSQRIHVCCNTSTTNLDDFPRWFQTDGNTQVFRLFVNDQNTASDRVGAARCEAFMDGGWDYSDNVTYEWTGRYTIARRQQSYAIFQLFNLDNEWALQLSMTGDGGLLINNRRNAGDVVITNPDGSTKDFDGKGFDVRVIDDGKNYKCWIDGVLVAENFYDRPTNISRFRWGKYMGDAFLTSPSTNSVILVSGAQVKSWPGRLDAATTDIVKANNSTNLGNTASWTGATVPGINNRAIWNSTVTTANATTLNTGLTWAGIRITNPGGNVTINGTATLKLEDAGLDMGTATRSLTVNCPVEPNVTAPWVIAASRVATFNDPINGYQGITLSGSGRLILNAANTYTGPTTINGGILQLGNGGTTGALDTDSAISVASGATFTVDQSDAVTQGTHFSGAAITGAGGLEKSGTGTLALTASNLYSGNTAIAEGTLQLGNGGTVGTLGTGSAISVASGATFAVNRSDAVTQGSHFSGAPITGAGGLAKSNTGTLTLTADNTYGGATAITGGILQVGNGGTTGTLGNNSATSVDTGATLRINRTDASLPYAYAGALSGAGTVEVIGGARLDFTANQTGSGSLRFNIDGILGIRTAPNSVTAVHLGALSGSGTIQRGPTAGGTATLSVGAANINSVFSGTIISSELGLEKVGTGTLTLTGSNTYGGATTVRAGTLAFGNVSPFNNTPVVNLSDGTLLRPTIGGATILAPINIGASGAIASISAPTNLPGSGAASTLTLAGAISGDGGITFTSSANQNALSTILLNGKSTYKGSTLMDTDGTTSSQIVVRLGTADALPPGTVLAIDGQEGDGSGRFADFNLNGFSQQLAGLTNTVRNLRSQRIVNSNSAAAATLTINNPANHTFSGSLGGGAAGSVSASAMPGSTGGNNFALTKGGAGTLTLSGSNSYSGNTTVNQGILALGSPNTNNQSSAVIIAATGATLNLAFSGTDTVNELFIGATRMPAGVYEAVGNPGTGTEIAQITGTGTLTVSTGPAVGYDAWKMSNGTTQPIDGDHDGDGVPNGIEHFLGGSGETTGITPLPSVANSTGTFSITWTKGGDYTGSYGTNFTVETSDSLTGTWTTEPAAPTPGATVSFPTASTVRYTFPTPAGGKKFVRLKVSSL